MRIQGRVQEVRLYGIDAPEHGQPGFQEAREALRRVLGRKQFWVEHQHTDQYGRMVGLIYHMDQHRRNSVNLRLVREGYAYAWTKYGGAELGFHAAEGDARQGRRGVWQIGPDGHERPWDYRRRNRGLRNQGDDRGTWLLVGGILLVVITLMLIAAGIKD